MKLIVGLGNPGKQYEKTRHNVGFHVVDDLRKELAFDEFQEKKKFDAFISEGSVNDEKILLVKPLTFMNLSGQCVQKLVKFYNVSLEDVWIIHDDLDFDVGVMKIREQGSSGSHNGMSSVIQSLGSEKFPRFRIGIESRTDKQKKEFRGRDYVLGKFSLKEKKTIKNVVGKCVSAIVIALKKGVVEAMNEYN